LAAILSTPCSFAILAAAFAWAQAQSLPLGTLAIMTIGAGMATPYLVLILMPRLLEKLPGAGKWMELFKQTVGFILLMIAVKLIGALEQKLLMNVLYFSVVLSFCVWMWGGWVDFRTKTGRKLLVRLAATAVAAAAGWWLFAPGPAEPIDWKPYDQAAVDSALESGRPVLIKFTAEWCMSCRIVERTVYKRAGIAGLIQEKNVFAVKADTTARDHPATTALKDRFREPGVPVSILLAPGKQERRYRGIAFGNELETDLEKL
jgi:thiol:disulfide interchange protein DsbD